MIRKFLAGLVLLVFGTIANSQTLGCSNGGVQGDPTQCLTLLTAELYKELASFGHQPCKPFYDTVHAGTTNGQYWTNGGNGLWTLWIWSYAEDKTDPNSHVGCSTLANEQAWQIVTTIDTYSESPGTYATISTLENINNSGDIVVFLVPNYLGD